MHDERQSAQLPMQASCYGHAVYAVIVASKDDCSFAKSPESAAPRERVAATSSTLAQHARAHAKRLNASCRRGNRKVLQRYV